MSEDIAHAKLCYLEALEVECRAASWVPAAVERQLRRLDTLRRQNPELQERSEPIDRWDGETGEAP